MFNNNFVANCPQYVPVKENRLIVGEDMENDKVGRFLGTQCNVNYSVVLVNIYCYYAIVL